MPTFERKTALVTGGSAGIGAALVRALADQGANVVLAARRKERLEALALELDPERTRVLPCVADVTEEGDMAAAADLARDRFGGIDLVIANAGYAVGGRYERMTPEDVRRQMEVNVFGVLRTIDATVADLKAARGRLVVIGSVNGYLAFPGGSAYAMSKFAVRGLCDSLRAELAPSGVSVTHVACGFIESDLRRTDNAGQLHETRADPVPAWLQMPAEVAARKILRASARRSRERVLTGHGKLGVWAARAIPGLMAWGLARSEHRRERRRER